jgi:5-methyltetrahydrofolate--homocysteine methyltransferase
VEQGLEDDLEPERMLYDALIPSLEEVGARFERGDYFVPEMLIAARAMQGALDILRPLLAETGAKPVATFLMGTVKGDVHDIGKNLCNIMLEGAGFVVVDLGVNVAPEKFVAAIDEHKPDIVGFSAFLTTTMPMFKANINALQKAGIRDEVIVMVGGAPVTQEYADAVGADGYSADASSAVKKARSCCLSGTRQWRRDVPPRGRTAGGTPRDHGRDADDRRRRRGRGGAQARAARGVGRRGQRHRQPGRARARVLARRRPRAASPRRRAGHAAHGPRPQPARAAGRHRRRRAARHRELLLHDRRPPVVGRRAGRQGRLRPRRTGCSSSPARSARALPVRPPDRAAAAPVHRRGRDARSVARASGRWRRPTPARSFLQLQLCFVPERLEAFARRRSIAG